MSKRFKGALLSATPPTTTGGTTGSGSAPGVWTLQQEMQAKGSSAWPEATNYIEDVFSTYLYTGNGATQTITNGIDLAGKGGLVWIKRRDAIDEHALIDTQRGTNSWLGSERTSAPYAYNGFTSFDATGFTLGAPVQSSTINGSARSLVSWTFRKQPKFFDVVTWTGNDVAGRTISHNLGAVPGTIIVKRTNSTANWVVYHRSLGATKAAFLNLTDAAVTSSAYWNDTSPTDTVFSIGTSGAVNEGGATAGTYIAYIFAHDAGGFGLTGTDNVISCGSYTCDGSGNFSVNLGYEPQWIMYKRTDSASSGGWYMVDNMRGLPVVANSTSFLLANSTAAENTLGNTQPTATGFSGGFVAGATCIYIAIRRGPMKTPTDGTKVFSPYSYAGNSGTSTVDFSFSPDTFIGGVINRTSFLINMFWDRIRGKSLYLQTSDSGGATAEVTDTSTVTAINQFGVTLGSDNKWNGPYNYIMYALKRAPGFFDEVCYTGNDTLRTISHNLGVAPEMMIIKNRNTALDWAVYHSGIGNTKYLFLNSTAAEATASTYWNNTSPTSSVFTVNTSNKVNSSPSPYVAYLFATCAGVSKVGSYTGTGTTKQIDCGFTNGARFVLIKRTDSTGDWYCWDTARGVVAGNDPYNLWNVAAAQVTTTDYIDPYSAGFELSSTAPAAINASGGTYIYLAIA